MQDLSTFKNNFDTVLAKFVDSKTESLLKNTKDLFIKDFVLYSKNLTKGGGKRIRPYMAYLAYQTFGGNNHISAMNVFLGLELFHNFCLIHDDIIDKSSTRHGQKTIHTYVLEKLKKENRYGDLTHVANSHAILVGDILFSWAANLFSQSLNPNLENIDKVNEYFYKMANEVNLGQIIDADLSTRDDSEWDLIENKTNLKTSYYSFVRPMQIGAVMANPKYNMEGFFEDLGKRLGVAFQIQDDLLDIIGDPKKIRKTQLLDITQHQQTFFTNYVLRNGTKEQVKYFKSIFGKQIKEPEKIQKLFRESGAIEKGQEIIKLNFEKAKKMIKDSNLKEEYKKTFFELIDLIEVRNN